LILKKKLNIKKRVVFHKIFFDFTYFWALYEEKNRQAVFFFKVKKSFIRIKIFKKSTMLNFYDE